MMFIISELQGRVKRCYGCLRMERRVQLRSGRSSGGRAAGEEMHKKRHRPARRALVVGRRGSGDVEVHPSCAASRDGFRGPLGGARFPERFEAEMVCETKGKTMETV